MFDIACIGHEQDHFSYEPKLVAAEVGLKKSIGKLTQTGKPQHHTNISTTTLPLTQRIIIIPLFV